MKLFERSKWIWAREGARPDEYAEFIEEVNFNGKKAELCISSDSNYTVYVNGTLAAFGQYADFPYMKVYDRIPGKSEQIPLILSMVVSFS